MLFLYQGLTWPSAEHSQSLMEGTLFLRGWNGDCTLYPQSPSRQVLEKDLYFLHSLFIDCPHYVRHWTQFWGPAQKIKCWPGRQMSITHTNINWQNGIKRQAMPWEQGKVWEVVKEARDWLTGQRGQRKRLEANPLRKVVRRVDYHTEPCRKVPGTEGLFAAGQMVQISSTQTIPFLIIQENAHVYSTAILCA